MSTSWPNWIKPVTSKSYGYSYDGANMNNAEGLGGLSRANLKYYQNKVQFSCVFLVNNGAQMQAFNDWYFNRSNQGTTKFTMDLDSGNGLEEHTCIIVPGSFSVTGDFPWTITCTIEAEKVITPAFDGALYDLMQAGYTEIEQLMDRLAIFSNEDVLLFQVSHSAPVFGLDFDAVSISENTKAGDVVYTASATSDTAITYSLSGVDASYFSVNSDNGDISILSQPDVDVKGTYIFDVVARNDIGSTSLPIGVAVARDSTAPVITSDSDVSYNYDDAAGTVIHTVTAIDDGEISFTASADQSISINSMTGSVSINVSGDLVTAGSFTVYATDSSGNQSSQLITLTRVEAEIEDGLTSDAHIYIADGTAAGSVIYTITGNASAGVDYYSISGNDADKFSVDRDTGVVTNNNVIDFASTDIGQYIVGVQMTDNNGVRYSQALFILEA